MPRDIVNDALLGFVLDGLLQKYTYKQTTKVKGTCYDLNEKMIAGAISNVKRPFVAVRETSASRELCCNNFDNHGFSF